MKRYSREENDTGITEVEEFFIGASSQPLGLALQKTFLDARSAESFRTSLYRIKKKLRDNTVSISISTKDNTVYAQKMTKSASFNIVDEKREKVGEYIVKGDKEEKPQSLEPAPLSEETKNEFFIEAVEKIKRESSPKFAEFEIRKLRRSLFGEEFRRI